jgi:hypothetical protein
MQFLFVLLDVISVNANIITYPEKVTDRRKNTYSVLSGKVALA